MSTSAYFDNGGSKAADCTDFRAHQKLLDISNKREYG